MNRRDCHHLRSEYGVSRQFRPSRSKPLVAGLRRRLDLTGSFCERIAAAGGNDIPALAGIGSLTSITARSAAAILVVQRLSKFR